MQGKVCLITGASSGIGLTTALGLARKGARVVLLCRDGARGAAARDEIRAKSGSDTVELVIADLSAQREVRRAAAELAARYPTLDVLVNNAGLYQPKRTVTADGLETTFAVNHLGAFLLTLLLLDALKASAAARVVNVASEAHRSGTIRFDDLQGEKSYGGYAAYAQSKLANILFTYELARRLKGTAATANCLHPGVVATKIVREMPFVSAAWRLLFKGPEKGARTSVYLASSPEVEGVTGKYFVDEEEARSSPESRDPAPARRLWEVSERLCGVG